MGRKIGEYARRQKRDATNNGEDAKGKGKAKETSTKQQWENCDVTDEDAIVFEAYQVRLAMISMEHTSKTWWLMMVSTTLFINRRVSTRKASRSITAECRYSCSFTLKEVLTSTKRMRDGNL